MVKELLTVLALAGSVAFTPSASVQHSYTSYYRVTGDYDTLDYYYSGLYFDTRETFGDLLDIMVDGYAQMPQVTYTIANTINEQCHVIAFDGSSTNFSLDTYYWAILTDYEDSDRVDTCFYLMINPNSFIDLNNVSFNYCVYFVDTSVNSFNYSYNTLWTNLPYGFYPVSFGSSSTYGYICNTFAVNGFGYADTDLPINDYYHFKGFIQFDFRYGISGTSMYDVGYDVGVQDGYSQGYSNGYYQGELYGRSQGSNFYTLLSAIADTPVITLRSLFNVNFFGVNIFLVVTSLFTLLIVIWIIKKVLL